MAKKKSKTKISNEILSPLHEILEKTRLLLDTELNQKQKEIIKSIKSTTDSLILAIDDTMRMERGKLQMEEQYVSTEIKETRAFSKRETTKEHRILVAEDRPVNQQITLKLLAKAGYAADAVSNGAEAIKTLETSDYALVLMDVEMPEMNGLEATRMIRDPQSNVRNHNIIIIALTGFDMDEDRDVCIQAGMNDYISKPINPEELIDTLERHLTNLEQ